MKMCDRVLGNPNIKEFEGLFLGISHAYTDIIPEVLKVPFANLAMSSQDIYYNYSILKYVIMKYPQKLRDVKYVLIDMYRYNYFNFDVSKSKVATRYFEWSGIWDDGHNFDAEQYQYLADLAIIKRYEGITDKKLDIWESLFKNVHQVEGYKSYGIYPDIYTRTEIANDEIIQKDCSKSIRGHD